MSVRLEDLIDQDIKSNPKFIQLFKNTVNQIYRTLLTDGQDIDYTEKIKKLSDEYAERVKRLNDEYADRVKKFEQEQAKRIEQESEIKIMRLKAEFTERQFEEHKRYELLEKHYLILQQEKQTLTSNLEILKPMADICNRFLKNKHSTARSAAEIGAEGEETIMEMFANTAFSGAKITRISVSVDHCCDLLFERGDFVCLIEVKRYSKAIPITQLEKFRNDMRLRNQTDGICCGIFISIGEERMGPYIRDAVEFTDKTVLFYSYLDSLEGLITLINHASSISSWMKTKTGGETDYIETIRSYYQTIKSRVQILSNLIAAEHQQIQNYSNEKKELEAKIAELTSKYCYLEKQIESVDLDEEQFVKITGLIEKNYFSERSQLVGHLKSAFTEYDKHHQYIHKRVHRIVMQICLPVLTVEQCLSQGKQLNMTNLSSCIGWNKNAYQLLRKIDDHAAENIKQYAKDIIS